eukprot:SAG31_NODE_457_length_15415_cov_4.380387_25_plen_39_part_00
MISRYLNLGTAVDIEVLNLEELDCASLRLLIQLFFGGA